MTMNWLDRRIAAPGPFLALCLSDTEFEEAVLHMEAPSCPRWVNKGAIATTHTFDHETKGLVCVVCMDGFQGRDPIEVAGLLIHEAVHVWQNYCDDIGERCPGMEQEAYGIQAIAQELMAEFVRRMEANA